MTNKTKKYIFAFVLFILMGGVSAGIMSIGNRYLRTHDLLNPYVKGMFTFILCMGIYFIYRWFSKRLDKISKTQ